MMTCNDLLVSLADIFETSVDQLTEDAGPTAIAGWDSLAALAVISLLDDSGVGEITTEDAASFTTVGAILRFAKSRGVISD